MKFLGVDVSFQPELKRHNQHKEVRFKTLHRIFQNRGMIRFVKNVIPEKARKKLKLHNIFVNSLLKDKTRKPLDPEYKQQLMKKCKSEVEKLSNFLDRDLLSLWEYNELD